jgi:energy-coupling factor transporter ATP-binding protein EcfA2
MVNLKFSPKNTNDTNKLIKSKISKNEPVDSTKLNPFRRTQDHSYLGEYTNSIVLPTSVKLVGLDNYSYILKNWYNDSLKDLSTKFMLLIGPTGCGKTTLINNFCMENNIESFITNDSIKTKKELLKDIIFFTQFKTPFDGVTEKNKLIFIDEYGNSMSDSLSINDINNLYELRNFNSSGNKKLVVKELSNQFGFDWEVLKTVKIPPVVIISSDSKGSRLSELKKFTDNYYINDIPKNLIKNFIVSSNEKFKNKEYSTVLDKIINVANNDIRFLINTVNFMGNDIKKDLLTDFHKNEDVNLFDFINKVFDNVDIMEIEDIFNIYDTDGYLISNLVQENYLDYSDNIFDIADSAESISYGDIVLNDLYDSNKVFMTDIHCVYSIYIPSVYSRSDVKKNKCPVRTSVINNRYNIYLNNKKIMDKLNLDEPMFLDIFTMFYIKSFINYKLIKSKALTQNEMDYLRNIMGVFSNNKIEKLELIYKSFNQFKDVPLNKTKTFTLKFKEKLNKLI